MKFSITVVVFLLFGKCHSQVACAARICNPATLKQAVLKGSDKQKIYAAFSKYFHQHTTPIDINVLGFYLRFHSKKGFRTKKLMKHLHTSLLLRNIPLGLVLELKYVNSQSLQSRQSDPLGCIL